MPTNYTPNYHLNQWEADDRVLRTDFNSDNAKLDAALAAQAEALAEERSTRTAETAGLAASVAKKQDAAGAVRIAVGSYTGDGAESRTIRVGFTPKAVLLFTQEGAAGPGRVNTLNHLTGGLAVVGHPLVLRWSGTPTEANAMEIVEGGFHVYWKILANSFALCTNTEKTVYNYLALG